MFVTKEFSDIKQACDYIKKTLAEIEVSKTPEFQVIHSIDYSQCSQHGGEWNEITQTILDYLLDLDSNQGYMNFDEHNNVWDFLDYDAPDELEGIYKPTDQDEIYVYAGEGLVVLYNILAVYEESYPIVVVKLSFWNHVKDKILDLLKRNEVGPEGSDYTSKISPALYVQLFFGEEMLSSTTN